MQPNLTPVALFLALSWGAIWALLIHYVPICRYWRIRHTWLTVVIGVGVDLLILYLVLPLDVWLRVVLVFVLSGTGIVFRSLLGEYAEHEQHLEQIDERG